MKNGKRVGFTLLISIALCFAVSGKEVADADSIETDNDASYTKAASSLMYLKNGDTKPLVGFSYGDEFDYNLFEISGSWGSSNLYRLKNSPYKNISYFFDADGHRFSGLSASGRRGEFFGITLGQDTIRDVADVLGEPDAYRNYIGNEDILAVYTFESSELSVNLYGDDNTIGYINYIFTKPPAGYEPPLAAQSEYDKDKLSACDYSETIYDWDITEGQGYYHPYDEGFDEAKKSEFIKNYLREHNMYKDTPDGITYAPTGEILAEYYKDAKGKEFCFVIHLWGDYWVDYEKELSEYTDAVFCATIKMDESKKIGSLIYNFDNDAITQEKLYDAQGKRMADVTYEYIPGIPFPFITKHWNLDFGASGLLCRNQHTWFYKERAQFDDLGRVTVLNENTAIHDSREYLNRQSKVIYADNGKLEAIQQELTESDLEHGWGWWDESIDYSGQFKFNYDTRGNISDADYIRPSYEGTWDSEGTLYYDEKERMISNTYYVTHGSHTNIFLYNGNSRMPWACLYWCSFNHGFETIRLFQPVK